MRSVETMLSSSSPVVIPLTAGCLCALLAACGTEESAQPQPQADSNWQITAVYTDPDLPGTVPDDVAGAATMFFGEQVVTGSTGCASFTAPVTYRDVEAVTTAFPSAVSLEWGELTMADAGGSGTSPACEGKAAYFHETLVGLLNGTWGITHDSPTQTTLRSTTADVDAPVIEMVTG